MHGMNIKVMKAPVLYTDGVLSLDCSWSSRWYWHCIVTSGVSCTAVYSPVMETVVLVLYQIFSFHSFVIRLFWTHQIPIWLPFTI